jgi:ankyrin repeat protein
MENKYNLFELIKSHQYSKLIDIIKSDENIDLNEVDETNTYLIQYAILFRQKQLVALLISKGCKLDIMDSDGRSIFYIPIKYGYNEIVSLLINFSDVVVGIPLLELQDKNKNIPLHYAIMFNKYDIIFEILKTDHNFTFKDVNGNTALHLMVKNIKSDKTDLIKLMLSKRIGLSYTNNYGQNALHIAIDTDSYDTCEILLNGGININTETIESHITPLLQATINNNIPILQLLLKYNPDVNFQDIYGNSSLNHSIMNKSKQIIEQLYLISNVNLVNISGKSAIYLFFDSEYDLSNLDEYYFREILLKSDINLQDNQGKTLWHYLVENDIWVTYFDILINKKNKIFIQDINGITPYDHIKKKEESKDYYNKFINLITNSFYNCLITKPNLNIYNIELEINKKNNALKQIKKIIEEDHISYPSKKKSYCISEIDTTNIKFSSYTGIGLDIVCGLLYLLGKHKHVDTSLTDNFIDNPILNNYYKSNGITTDGLFLNYEIIWSFQRLFIPSILNSKIKQFLKDNSKQFLVIPLGIELSNGSHANILLYDKTKGELERFEPYGKSFPPGYNYNPINLDQNIKNLFNSLFEESEIKIKYVSPSDYEPKIGLQLLDTQEYTKDKNIGDPGGFCGAWSLFYVEMRINNKNIPKNNLIGNLINHIRLKRVTFRSVIRNFTKNITDIRDKILMKADIDINLWLNDTYNKDQYDTVLEEIKRLINI